MRAIEKGSARANDQVWAKAQPHQPLTTPLRARKRSSSLRKTKSQIFTNRSACKLKLGDLEGAPLDTNFAMRDGEDNVKALFRQGQAYMALGDIEAVVESFKKALDLEPTDCLSLTEKALDCVLISSKWCEQLLYCSYSAIELISMT
ncbi:hypothetical protein GBA52_004102 [Prunus armeniaca]|nr:hypothetical protein GBA52_004102 [Prunus armeniaca]